MKSIIDEIYFGNICGNDIKLPKNKNNQELELYDKLKSAITTEQLKTLDAFLNAVSDRVCLEHCAVYRHGFKTGFLLGTELSNKEDI